MARWLAGVLGGIVLIAAGPAPAEDLRTIHTSQSFDGLVKRVEREVEDRGLAVVSRACASCGAARRGLEIPGNMVLGVFRNDYAIRMLAASVAAGIEAPIRFYVTESEGGADLHWKRPSDVFAPYDEPGLDELGKELDLIFEEIGDAATK